MTDTVKPVTDPDRDRPVTDEPPSKTDPTIWTMLPVFGVAGGPLEVALTAEGNARAFSVGAQVRRGAPAEALEAIHAAGGAGYLSCRGEGSRIRRTDLGRFDQVTWGRLRVLGLIESFQDEHGDGVRLTAGGRSAVAQGFEERVHALERCRRVAAYNARHGGGR
jgi:hypothetical protein